MMWHFQPTRLTARYIQPPGTPEDHSEPDAICQVDLRTDGLAFIHAAKTHPPISRLDWYRLARKLVREYGATRVEGDIGGELLSVDASRVMRGELSTNPVDKLEQDQPESAPVLGPG